MFGVVTHLSHRSVAAHCFARRADAAAKTCDASSHWSEALNPWLQSPGTPKSQQNILELDLHSAGATVPCAATEDSSTRLCINLLGWQTPLSTLTHSGGNVHRWFAAPGCVSISDRRTGDVPHHISSKAVRRPTGRWMSGLPPLEQHKVHVVYWKEVSWSPLQRMFSLGTRGSSPWLNFPRQLSSLS